MTKGASHKCSRSLLIPRSSELTLGLGINLVIIDINNDTDVKNSK